MEDIKFLENHQVELTIDGPDKVENIGSLPCCLQQGPMMIGNYSFYYKGSIIYNVISNPTWENGYTMENILDANNCLSKDWGKHLDCSTVYEAQHTCTRADNYDPTKFPSPGETIGFAVTVYAHCFNYYETTCLRSCLITGAIPYDPPE